MTKVGNWKATYHNGVVCGDLLRVKNLQALKKCFVPKKKKKKQCCQGTAFKMDMSSLELCTCFEKMCIYGAYWFTFTLMCKI